jgi:hypothetical protein
MIAGSSEKKKKPKVYMRSKVRGVHRTYIDFIIIIIIIITTIIIDMVM